MSMNTGKSIRRTQAGVATLAITMLLLFAISLAALFANRSLIFQQRASANQIRAAKAFEAAESGLEWATAMLNEPRGIDSLCRPKPSSTPFRTKYVPMDDELALQIVPNSHPACRFRGTSLACSCPDSGTNPDLIAGDEDGASFAISFEAVATDPDSSRVISAGCTSISADCIPGADTGPADAIAHSSVILKLRPLLRVLPGAALTAGGSVSLSGSTVLRNVDRLTAGILVEAGGDVLVGDSVQLASLPGSPAINALAANESSLGRLNRESDDGESFFNAFFAMPIGHYRATTMVRTVSDATAGARGQALLTAYQQGYDAFYVDGDLVFESPSIGSTSRPLLLVSSRAIACSQACTVHGLIYSDSTLTDRDAGTGVQVRGAVIARGDHRQSTGDSVSYDPATLSRLRQQAAIFVRVPGSWRDF